MASRWPGLVAALVLLLRTAGAQGHAEHMPEHFVLQAYVKRDGAKVELLLRTPLFLFTNVGLPLHGRGAIDIAAFRADDPHVQGTATYAERAANAVNSAMDLYAGERLVRLEARHIQLAQHDNAAFASYASARRHLAGDWPAADTHIDHSGGFVDVLFTGQAPSDAALAFAPTISPALAERTTFGVTVVGPDDTGQRRLDIPGSADRVPLAP